MSTATDDTLAKIIWGIVLIPATVALWTWLYMLILGAVHSFIPVIPALGYGQTFLFSILLGMTGGGLGINKLRK